MGDIKKEVGDLLDNYDFSAFETPSGDLKQRLESTLDPDAIQVIKTEMDSLNFSLRNGKLEPMFSTTDKSGLTIHEYPSIRDFTEPALMYLTERISKTTNSRLKATYGQILFNSGLKEKGVYLKMAVDSLVDNIKVDHKLRGITTFIRMHPMHCISQLKESIGLKR